MKIRDHHLMITMIKCLNVASAFVVVAAAGGGVVAVVVVAAAAAVAVVLLLFGTKGDCEGFAPVGVGVVAGYCRCCS